jgi:protoporphyrin/coproporphyrin ferrochelatase
VTLPGILLLAHGGPHSLEEVPAFLEQVREGRPCSEELVSGVKEKYRLIGGASPLPAITQRTATKLEDACGLPVYVGMLHWHPLLEETISQMVRDGVSSALVICLVPHFSECSVGRYRRRTTAAADERGLQFDFVESWHTLPSYLEGLAESVETSWNELDCAPGEQTHVIFSAHSLPKAALPPEDPYEQQLHETADGVAERLGLPHGGWTVAYQSISGPGQDWLGPSVDESVRGLSDQGITQAVICPFGFVADQVEILHDLDVVTKQKAGDLGVTVARTPLLNDGSALIDSLTLLAERWDR